MANVGTLKLPEARGLPSLHLRSEVSVLANEIPRAYSNDRHSRSRLPKYSPHTDEVAVSKRCIAASKTGTKAVF